MRKLFIVLILTSITNTFVSAQNDYYYPDGVNIGIGIGYANLLGSGVYKDANRIGNFGGGYDLAFNAQWASSKRPRIAPMIEISLAGFSDANRELQRTRWLSTTSIGVGVDYYITKKKRNLFLHSLIGYQMVEVSDSSYVTRRRTDYNSSTLGGRAGLGYEFSDWITPVRVLAYVNFAPVSKIGGLEADNKTFLGIRVAARIGQRVFQGRGWREKEKDRRVVTYVAPVVETPKYCLVSVQVADEGTRQNLERAIVRYRNIETNELKEVETNTQGLANLQLPFNQKYQIQAFGKGYFFKNQEVSTGDVYPCEQLINLSLLSFAGVFETNEILFDYNEATLKTESKIVLNEIIEVLKVNPNIRMEIRAHTDSDGMPEANKLLSDKRANSVVDYLVKEGKLDKNRLKALGFGESQLKYQETDAPNDEGKRRNRRVELKVLE
jgi:outer membrane protein OmpA-like peptidoglycan-associated protein